MAARFWVTGGTGNWNDTSNWSATSGGASGASVPGSADTATLNANSGSGTITLDISPTIQTLTCTGFTGTLAFGTNTISLNSTGTIFTGATTMTVTGTPQIICTNSSATARTISPGAGITEANSISFRVTAGTGGFTVTSTHVVRDLDFTDGVNPTGFAGAYGNVSNTIFGNFKASTGMTRTAGTGTLTFAATSGTKTINTAGVTFDCPFTFNGVGGTWQLQAALTSGATRTCTLTNGTLDLAGYTLTTGLVASNNSNVRTLAFGSGKIVLTNNGGNILSMSTATNFSYTGTSRIECNYSGSIGTRTIIPPATNAVESSAMNIYVTAGTDTVTVSGAARFLTFDLTGFAGTLTYVSSTRYFGDLVFSSGMTLGTVAGGFTFAKTSGTQTITSNGKTIDQSVVVDAPGAIVSLQDALTLGSTRTLTLTNGTLTTNGYALTLGNGFSSSNTNVRTLNLGASAVTISGTSIPWNITDPTNMTLNAGTSSLVFTGTASASTFQGGGFTYYDITLPTGTSSNFQFSGTNTFRNVTATSPVSPGRRLIIIANNQTITGTLSCSGSAANSRNRIASSAVGVAATLTVASVAAISDVDFSDIILTGAAAPVSGTRLSDGKGNTGIVFSAGVDKYWNQPAGGVWSDAAWALSSGGAVNANNFPLAQDTVIFDNTGVGSGTTISIQYGWFMGTFSAGSLTNLLTIDWTSVTGGQSFIFGDVTLSSAITFTSSGTAPVGLAGRRDGGFTTITSAGVVWTQSTVNINCVAPNSVKLGDTLTASGVNGVNLATGSLDLNNNILNTSVFSGSTFSAGLTRSIDFNGGSIDVSGNNATVWSFGDLSGFSYTGTPTVNFTYSGSAGTRTINNGTTGATESNVVDFNVTAGSDQWTATANNSVRNLNCTGFSGVTGLFGAGFIYGNLTLSPTQTVTASSSATTFAATSGTKTITTNGVTIDRPLVFQGAGGTWSLQDALTLGATRALGLFNGTLNTNGYAVSCGRFNASDAGATGNRTLNLGATSFTVVGTSTATMSWQIEVTTYTFTLNAGTSTIFMAEPFSGTSTQDFIGGGKTYYNVVYSGGEASTIYGSNTFRSISNSTQPLALSFEAGTTQTVDNFNVSGTSGNLVTMTSATPGTRWNLAKRTGGKVLVSFCSITDSAASPAGYWFAPTSQGNVNGGNNTGWNFASTGQNSGFMLLL